MDNEFSLIERLKNHPTINRVELTYVWPFTSIEEVGPYVVKYDGRNYDWEYCYMGPIDGLSKFLNDYPFWNDEYEILLENKEAFAAHISRDGTTFKMFKEGFSEMNHITRLPDSEDIYDIESEILRKTNEPVTDAEKGYTWWF